MLHSTWSKVAQRLHLSSLLSATSEQNHLKERLIRNFAGSSGLQISFIILSFIINVFLARFLNKVDYGIYSYAITWMTVLAIPSTLGLANLLGREVAIYQSQSAWRMLRGLLQWSTTLVFFISTAIATVAILIVLNLEMSGDQAMRMALCVAFVSLPINCLTRLRLSTMQGLHKVVLGQLPEMLIQPLLFLIFILCGYGWLNSKEDGAVLAVIFKVIADLIVFVIGLRLLRKVLPKEVKAAIPQYTPKTWIKQGVPFILLSGLFVINSRLDILMLGSMKDIGAVGIYSVIIRITILISLMLQIMNKVLSPTYATLYAEGKREQLQRLVTHSTRLITVFSLGTTILIVGFSSWILLIFGSQFIQGKTALIILSIGHLINAMTGSVSLLLHATRNANLCTLTSIFCVFLNIILNRILIPQWGISGAATATATSMIFANIINAIWVYKKLGIKSTAFIRITTPEREIH